MRKDIIYKTLKRIQPVMLRAYATTPSHFYHPSEHHRLSLFISSLFVYLLDYVRMCGNHDAFQMFGKCLMNLKLMAA